MNRRILTEHEWDALRRRAASARKRKGGGDPVPADVNRPNRGSGGSSVTLAIDPQSSILSPGGRALVRAASAILEDQE